MSESTDYAHFVLAGYALTAILIGGYAFSLVVRQRAVDREIRQLRASSEGADQRREENEENVDA